MVKKTSRTDWERVNSMKDEEIDFSDAPELDESFFAKAVVRNPRQEKRRMIKRLAAFLKRIIKTNSGENESIQG